MIIGTCGFGSTGSSVVSDYLKEFGSFQVLDKAEFTWVSAVDGLVDLDYHINHPHSRTAESISAIERYRILCKKRSKSFRKMGISEDVFLLSVNKFLNSIIQTRWMWRNNAVSKNIIDKIIRILIFRLGIVEKWELKHGCHWSGYPLDEVCFSVKPENFDVAAINHVKELLIAMGVDFSNPIVLDQPFPGNNPQSCMKYYEDSYAVVVDRDPRDNYVFARTKLLGNAHLMPINSVKDFVVYYRALRKNQPYLQPDDRILKLQFEDFIYHYDETTFKLRQFLSLPDNPNPKSIFDPNISMPNTQVWKRFPQFYEDIIYIENELPEYLFDFSGCPEPDPNGKMFKGKSPKNI